MSKRLFKKAKKLLKNIMNENKKIISKAYMEAYPDLIDADKDGITLKINHDHSQLVDFLTSRHYDSIHIDGDVRFKNFEPLVLHDPIISAKEAQNLIDDALKHHMCKLLDYGAVKINNNKTLEYERDDVLAASINFINFDKDRIVNIIKSCYAYALESCYIDLVLLRTFINLRVGNSFEDVMIAMRQEYSCIAMEEIYLEVIKK